MLHEAYSQIANQLRSLRHLWSVYVLGPTKIFKTLVISPCTLTITTK